MTGEFVHGEGSMLWDVMVNQLKVPLKFTHDLSKETPKECGLGMLIGRFSSK